MTRDDIKVGMVVETRNGKLYMVMEDALGNKCLVREEGYHLDFSSYDKDLNNISSIGMRHQEFDIIKVYDRPRPAQFSKTLELSTRDRELLYNRKDVREMTMEELTNLLGYEIKIIK